MGMVACHVSPEPAMVVAWVGSRAGLVGAHSRGSRAWVVEVARSEV